MYLLVSGQRLVCGNKNWFVGAKAIFRDIFGDNCYGKKLYKA
jgi:hypothetical protein